MTFERELVLKSVADRVALLRQDRPVLVAIDGVDGAGKTTFANELAEALATAPRPVVRASVDDFHSPHSVRYRLGRWSPDGFYLDSYDYDSFRSSLLDRWLSCGMYRKATFDCDAERAIDTPLQATPPAGLLIIDGIFLHRRELRHYWDLSVFLDVPFEISIPRGAARGIGDRDVFAAHNHRYIEGQRRYFADCSPWDLASIVIDNSQLQYPHIVAMR